MKKQEASWNETMKSIAMAVLIAMILRSLLLEFFYIPSGSMKNTLLVGDYVMVSKFSYGYSRYSFPFGFNIFNGRVFDTEPKRGDVIVFRPPKKPNVDYIKRLVGLPGDKIQVISGHLQINGKPVFMQEIGSFTEKNYLGEDIKLQVYNEKFPEGNSHNILDMTMFGAGDNTKIYTVPDGHYFMMGDNRDNSADSRFPEVGFVPKENLVGRAEFIVFSLKKDVRFWQIWKWFDGIRINRIGTKL